MGPNDVLTCGGMAMTINSFGFAGVGNPNSGIVTKYDLVLIRDGQPVLIGRGVTSSWTFVAL